MNRLNLIRTNPSLRRVFALGCVSIFLFICAFSVTGCNTIEGAGEDIEAAGDSIDEAAEDAG